MDNKLRGRQLRKEIYYTSMYESGYLSTQVVFEEMICVVEEPSFVWIKEGLVLSGLATR